MNQLPTDLKNRIDIVLEEEAGGETIALPPIKFINGNPFLIGEYFVMPFNTAGSYDYHSWRQIAQHNVLLHKHIDMKETHACAQVNIKEDHALEACIVLYCAEYKRSELRVFFW